MPEQTVEFHVCLHQECDRSYFAPYTRWVVLRFPDKVFEFIDEATMSVLEQGLLDLIGLGNLEGVILVLDKRSIATTPEGLKRVGDKLLVWTQADALNYQKKMQREGGNIDVELSISPTL